MGYKLYNPITHKVIMTRDVIFEEEKMWDWEEKKTTQNSEPIFEEELEELRDTQEEPQSPSSPSDSSSSQGSKRVSEATEEDGRSCAAFLGISRKLLV